MRITCCRDCGKREAGCHAKCEEYLSAREKVSELREKIRQENDLRAMVNDAQWNGYRRTNLNKIRKGRK